jgi:hypothetical protein
VEAEEAQDAQDAQVIRGDAARGVADEADVAGAQCARLILKDDMKATSLRRPKVGSRARCSTFRPPTHL